MLKWGLLYQFFFFFQYFWTYKPSKMPHWAFLVMLLLLLCVAPTYPPSGGLRQIWRLLGFPWCRTGQTISVLYPEIMSGTVYPQRTRPVGRRHSEEWLPCVQSHRSSSPYEDLSKGRGGVRKVLTTTSYTSIPGFDIMVWVLSYRTQTRGYGVMMSHNLFTEWGVFSSCSFYHNLSYDNLLYFLSGKK